MAKTPIQVRVVSTANEPQGNVYTCQLNGYTINFYVYNNVFGNCQVFAIGKFNSLLQCVQATGGPGLERLEEILNQIRTACNITKTLMTIDVREEKYNQFKEHCNVVAHYAYNSTNGSKMAQCLINTNSNN